MKPNTNELLLRLEKTDWFCNAGRPVETSSEVAQVKTWTEALEVYATQASDDARLEAKNELTVYLDKHHRDGLSLWNHKIDELRPLVIKLMDKKLATPAIRGRMPREVGKDFLDALRWELMNMCMSREYEDLVRTRYYGLLEQWFLAGHFPCGWIGDVPDDLEDAFTVGKLAVL